MRTYTIKCENCATHPDRPLVASMRASKAMIQSGAERPGTWKRRVCTRRLKFDDGEWALIVVSAALGLDSSVQCRRAVRLAASRTGSVRQRGLDLCV